MHCILCIELYSFYSIYCILCNVFCLLYSIDCIIFLIIVLFVQTIHEQSNILQNLNMFDWNEQNAKHHLKVTVIRISIQIITQEIFLEIWLSETISHLSNSVSYLAPSLSWRRSSLLALNLDQTNMTNTNWKETFNFINSSIANTVIMED